MAIAAPIEARTVRCAIYTRKSTDHGLERQVNSLETQRSVCQAYIRCQAHRNWIELPQRYDDGGFSGGNLERPALQRLISDIEAGRIDVIIIYKIDRLSRSLTDFVRLMDVLDRYGASFVSVTQTFDTSDSMGRLVLNILLTFAQFERELMSDRVRDKKAALRRKGYFVGGTPPIGYLISRGKKLVPDLEWSSIIEEIFQRFPGESANQIARDLQQRGVRTRRFKTKAGRIRGGQKVWPKMITNILRNPLYAGYFIDRGELAKAEVRALVTLDQWNEAQMLLRDRFPSVRDPVVNFLVGILHDEVGRRMKILRSGPGRSRTYRYYRSEGGSWASGARQRRVLVEAERVEQLAICTLKALLVDRIKLKESVLSLGLYSSEIGRILRRGPLSARRLELMDPIHRRELFLALVSRAEVNRSGLRLLISCRELARFLAWDGQGIFRQSEPRPGSVGERFRLIYAPAFLICGHPYFALPIARRPEGSRQPDLELIALLEEAAELRLFMLTNRDLSISELASRKKMGASYFARILRVNYLAPDIQTAIFDGTQPPGLTRHRILFGSLPLDWEQQRQLMGFG